MKIYKHHYNFIKDKIKEMAKQKGVQISKLKEIYENNGLTLRRFVFDLSYAAKLTNFICEHIYPYANEDHLYTALKKAAKDIITEEKEIVK